MNTKKSVSGASISKTPARHAAEGDLAARYEQVQSEAAALHDAQVLTYNLDATYAAGVARSAFERCRPVLPTLCAMPDFKAERAQTVAVYADALQYVHAQVTSGAAPKDKLAEQAVEACSLLDRFEASAASLVTFGKLEARTVVKYRNAKYRGYRPIVEALDGYVLVLRAQWKAVGSKLFITEADLDAAAKLARTMTLAIGTREKSEGELSRWIEQRRRVATLLIQGYTELRRGMAYLRFHYEDAATFTPSLYLSGRAAPVEKTPDEKPAEDTKDAKDAKDANGTKDTR